MTAGEGDGRFFRHVLDSCPDLLCVYDLTDQRIIWCNDAAGTILGIRPEELVAETTTHALGRFLDEPERALVAGAVRQVTAKPDGDVVSLRVGIGVRDDRRRWVSARLAPFRRDDDGRVIQCLVVARDVTHDVEAEDRLSYRTLHDALTGLANRILIRDRLEAAIKRASRGGSIGLLFCDLDNFKRINDDYGHRAGDDVLRVVADRILHSVRPGDTVGRLGGDEFIVITDSEGDVLPVVQAIKERIRAEVAEPIRLGADEVTIRASIGVGIARGHDDPDALLDAADAAMYADKRRRGGYYSLDTSA